MATRQALILGLKVIGVAQAIAILEWLTAFGPWLIVPAIDQIVTRTSKGRQRASVCDGDGGGDFYYNG